MFSLVQKAPVWNNNGRESLAHRVFTKASPLSPFLPPRVVALFNSAIQQHGSAARTRYPAIPINKYCLPYIRSYKFVCSKCSFLVDCGNSNVPPQCIVLVNRLGWNLLFLFEHLRMDWSQCHRQIYIWCSFYREAVCENCACDDYSNVDIVCSKSTSLMVNARTAQEKHWMVWKMYPILGYWGTGQSKFKRSSQHVGEYLFLICRFDYIQYEFYALNTAFAVSTLIRTDRQMINITQLHIISQSHRE